MKSATTRTGKSLPRVHVNACRKWLRKPENRRALTAMINAAVTQMEKNQKRIITAAKAKRRGRKS